jgi:hypothetical protein
VSKWRHGSWPGAMTRKGGLLPGSDALTIDKRSAKGLRHGARISSAVSLTSLPGRAIVLRRARGTP